MKPVSIRVRNYRSFVGETTVELTAGCVGISGPNGSGKSSLIEAVPFAIFGPEGRSAEPYLAQDADGDLMEVELELEHGGERYRIRRSYSARGRGKTTCDFERWWENETHEAWTPVTEATQADTQAAIERTLGLSRETFEASAFLGQGKGPAFTSAQPKDRKRLLADVLGLDLWERARESVSADRSHQQRLAAEFDGRMALLAEQAGDPLEAEIAAKTLALELEVCEEDLAAAQADAAQAAEAVASVERQEAQREARATAVTAAKVRWQSHAKVAVEAEAAVPLVAQLRAEVADYERDDAERRGLAVLVEQKREQSRAGDAAAAEITRHEADAAALAERLSDQTVDLGRIDGKLEALSLPGSVCDRCQQELDQAARESARESLDRERAAANVTIVHTQTLIVEARAAAANVVIPDPVEGLADTEQRLAELAHAPAHLATANERLRALDEKIEAAAASGYIETAERLRTELEQAVAALEALEPTPPVDGLRGAKYAADERAADVSDNRERLRTLKAEAEAALRQADRIAAELDAARAQHIIHAAECDQLQMLERAFGRDGVPAWIVEQQAIPAIEAEANRILAELAGPVSRVELRTERELKTGGTRDALDIVCATDVGARGYETFSGGERCRVDVALRLALARLLAHRRGAEVRWLALDEPESLDDQGMQALAGVLRGLVQEGVVDSVMLASHVPALRDAFDANLIVTRNGGGSVVEVA